MLKRWATWPPRGIRWWGAIAVVVLAPAIVWALFVPLADWLAHHDVGSVTGSLHETALDNARGRLLTLGAGLFAAGALVFTARNFTLSREGQVTDRYTKAIEQLGSDKLDVRIGGIYALERVARDSARDHPTVMEVLAAFIREYSHEQWPPPKVTTLVVPTIVPPRTTRPDVQAAVTVIGRRDAKRDIPYRSIDLTGANLTGANLTGANLADADLTGANLTDANLGMDLSRLVYIGAVTAADLARPNLTRPNLTRAIFAEANLTEATLFGANLTHAIFADADLTGADLAGADLTHANLMRADLTGATLTNAELTDANLSGARWHEHGSVPEGWKLDTSSGRLTRAGTGSGPAEAN